jgi:hypothetical protein
MSAGQVQLAYRFRLNDPACHRLLSVFGPLVVPDIEDYSRAPSSEPLIPRKAGYIVMRR